MTRKFSDDTGDVPYYFSVIVEEKSIRMNRFRPAGGVKPVKAGEPINLGIRLADNKLPLQLIYSITAKITGPKNSDRAIIASYSGACSKITDKMLKSEPEGYARRELSADKKVTVLRRDKSTSELTLKPAAGILTHPGVKSDRGLFRAEFKNTKVPGMYKTEYRIRGTAGGGTFERFISTSHTVTVRPDKENTIVTGILAGEKKSLELTVTPKDIYGNLLGPGQADSIKPAATGTRRAIVSDNIDGSYRISIPADGMKELSAISLTLKIMGSEIFRGRADLLAGVRAVKAGDIMAKAEKQKKAAEAKKAGALPKDKTPAKPSPVKKTGKPAAEKKIPGKIAAPSKKIEPDKKKKTPVKGGAPVKKKSSIYSGSGLQHRPLPG